MADPTTDHPLETALDDFGKSVRPLEPKGSAGTAMSLLKVTIPSSATVKGALAV